MSPAPPTTDSDHQPQLPLLTIQQLRQQNLTSPQPHRLHLQLAALHQRTASTGSLYLEAQLADHTDTLTWRLFDSNPCFHSIQQLQAPIAIELQAEWVDTGKFGIEPRAPQLRPLTPEERESFLAGDPTAHAAHLQDWQTILDHLQTLTDPRLHALCQLFLQRFEDRYRRAAAAKENHHAQRGGLVQHVAQMMRSATALCSAYPSLNHGLIITGILFHDCGKMWENGYPDQSFTQVLTLHGEMLGHIPLGMELINKLWRDLTENPDHQDWQNLQPPSEHVRLHLLHLIASHHGQLDYGSPILPKTPEAIALHHIDNIDAKLEMLRRGYATSKEVAPHIYDRFRPWPTRIVEPLPTFSTAPPPPPTQEA